MIEVSNAHVHYLDDSSLSLHQIRCRLGRVGDLTQPNSSLRQLSSSGCPVLASRQSAMGPRHSQDTGSRNSCSRNAPYPLCGGNLDRGSGTVIPCWRRIRALAQLHDRRGLDISLRAPNRSGCATPKVVTAAIHKRFDRRVADNGSRWNSITVSPLQCSASALPASSRCSAMIASRARAIGSAIRVYSNFSQRNCAQTW